jgi:type VI secretion system protein ImpG
MDEMTSGADLLVLDDLISHGQEFSFGQVMRIARRHLGAGGARELPEVPWQERVRVRPELSLAFPAADLARVDRFGDQLDELLVTTTFLGLYGSSSPLPTHYTEDLLHEASDDSSASRDFLDLIHQRLYHLYFQCWSKYRLFSRVAEEKNPRDLERLFCLIGLGEMEQRDQVPEAASLLRYAGLFSQHPRSAAGLETMLRDALGTRVLSVEQWVLRQVPIPADQQMRLGIANRRLGLDTVVGIKSPDRMGKFRIHIGPLTRLEFNSFLPGTPKYQELMRLTRLYLVDPLDFNLRITMIAGEAQPICLGDPDGPRLGWNTWCFTGAARRETSALFSKALCDTDAPAPVTEVPDKPTKRPVLIDYYQQELARLRDLAAGYTTKHPELAAMMSGHPADPSVERLFEGVAFLNANLQQKLDDDFPELIHELTEALHPWNLRPIPATTIVAFTPKADLMQPQQIFAGSEVASIAVQGTKCRFKTFFDVTLQPLKLLGAAFSHPAGKPPCINLQCELNGVGLSNWGAKSLRFFLGAGRPAACDLYLVLLRYLKRIVISSFDADAVVEIPSHALKSVGFAKDETMLGSETSFLPGHLILQEYFLFHDRFLFLELKDLEACRALGEGRRFEIRFELTACPLVLPQISEESFVLYATPVINLFQHKANPLRFPQGEIRQKLHPAGNDPGHFQIYSVDQITEFDPGSGTKRKYTVQNALHRSTVTDRLCQLSRSRAPSGDGIDTFISIQHDRNAPPDFPTRLNIDLTCTNGLLPKHLKVGDIRVPTSTTPESATFSNIKPVTIAASPNMAINRHWKLLSSFSLNYTSLDLIDGLRAILRLYVPERSGNLAIDKANFRKVEALESIEAKPADRLLGSDMYRGYEIRIMLRGDYFSGPGDLYLFSSVLERFLGGYVTQNCFIRLVVEEIGEGYQFEWPARLGDHTLL